MSGESVIFADGDDALLLAPEAATLAPSTAPSAQGEAGSGDTPGDSPAEPGGEPQPPPPPPETSVKPEDVGWSEWTRRQDAIRSVAREFEDIAEGDLREFLQGKTTRDLSDEELQQFQHDVRVHRVSDIADVLDEQLRSTNERLRRARRTVRVQAPRGWMKKAFNSLDGSQVEQVAARLLQRGHDADTIKQRVLNRVKDEEQRQQISDRIDAGEVKVQFSDPMIPLPVAETVEVQSPAQVMQFAIDMATQVAAGIKVPDVNVEVPVTIGERSKKIVRDPETGLVKEIIPEDE
jgi:hypothetical protein